MCAFLANQERKDRFLIFRVEKNKFKTRKVKFQKMCEKLYFSKGLVHVFCEKKCSFLPRGFFRETKAEKTVFFLILDWKEYFLDQKSELSKIS